MEASKITQNNTSDPQPGTERQNEQRQCSTDLAHTQSTGNEKKSDILEGGTNVAQSYYADKDLAWWLQLARDFKSARQVPLPDEDEGLIIMDLRNHIKRSGLPELMVLQRTSLVL
ncbi:hypothetical protein VTL71DRAFT_8147 [Oculimacula yallundae]|uniref:Uncharacterized protein n=1 Tax=Oculimacula yallundae TaxID=86028 RepID=A0ABR4CWS3_9HELO